MVHAMQIGWHFRKDGNGYKLESKTIMNEINNSAWKKIKPIANFGSLLKMKNAYKKAYPQTPQLSPSLDMNEILAYHFRTNSAAPYWNQPSASAQIKYYGGFNHQQITHDLNKLTQEHGDVMSLYEKELKDLETIYEKDIKMGEECVQEDLDYLVDCMESFTQRYRRIEDLKQKLGLLLEKNNDCPKPQFRKPLSQCENNNC
jgi:hypothetical protein